MNDSMKYEGQETAAATCANGQGNLPACAPLANPYVPFQLQNPDGILMKVCSYLPFSSYSAMFVRIGMGTVAPWEIVLSAIILFASTLGAGWLAAKIYRMGTLRYGNPIKFTHAIKNLRSM